MKLRSAAGLVVGIGIGYVLGSRAGRERYEQLRGGWHEFTESPTVQGAVAPIKNAVEPMLGGGRDEDLPGPSDIAALTADQLKERLRHAGTVDEQYHAHAPEEIIKERM